MSVAPRCWTGLDLPAPYAARIASLRRVMEALEFEIDLFTGMLRGRLARDPGYKAVRTIPGIGPVLAAVLLAEIGDITRFAAAAKLTCWAGMTPKHHQSDSQGPRGRITTQSYRLVRCRRRIGPTPARDQPPGHLPRPGRRPARPQHRRGRRRPPPTRVRLLRPPRPPRPRPTDPGHHRRPCSDGGLMKHPPRTGRRGRVGHDPAATPAARSRLLIDSADRSTAHPIMPTDPLRRRDDRQPPPPACRPPGTPALMSAPPPHPNDTREEPLNPSPPPTSSAERRRPQGPTAADAVAHSASLDPDASPACQQRRGQAPNRGHQHP